jgi:hypothetical protein
MAKPKDTKKPDPEAIDVIQVERGELVVALLGTESLIINRMSEKAQHELLLPKGRKTAADKATSLKHDPMAEFQASPYILPDDSQPTYLAIKATAFKGAMGMAALDLPGTKKAQIGRLVHVMGEYINVFGIPLLKMDIVRSADMNRTPDVRTRCALRAWAAEIRISYIKPLMRPNGVANLLGAAGMYIGVGDWRPEKGKGNYGLFRIVEPNNPEFLAIKKAGARAAQINAMDKPQCYDDETSTLLSWFEDEIEARTKQGSISKKALVAV